MYRPVNVITYWTFGNIHTLKRVFAISSSNILRELIFVIFAMYFMLIDFRFATFTTISQNKIIPLPCGALLPQPYFVVLRKILVRIST